MESDLICTSCSNRCLAPPSPSRDYACPRCGRLLPRVDGTRPRVAFGRERLTLGTHARYLLLLALLFGAAAAGVRGGLLGSRGAASASPEPPRALPLSSLTEAEQRNYDYRLRQLGGDLRRDETDFDVLRRLGQLHLRLASCRIGGRITHIRRARYYLGRAADVALTSREAQWVRGMQDAANSPNPSLDLIAMPGDFGTLPRVEEEVIRWRIGFFEEQVSIHPSCSRLLCRLADNYTALYLAIARGGERVNNRWPGASGVIDPQEARRLAENEYSLALRYATTHEARSRAMYGAAQLYRALDDPARAATALRAMLAVQPNNWYVALEMARLYRQLNQPAEATRYEALSARWRTPGWI